MISKFFRIQEHKSTIPRELSGGVITFLALSYILFVQPAILGTTGMDPKSVFVATCVCSGFACILMGFLSNLPIALAPAMGHNIFFAFVVCGAMAWSWQEALAANLIAGGIFVLLALFNLQNTLTKAIPDSLKYSIGVGIGLLITLVGLEYGGIVVADQAVYVKLGKLSSPIALLTLFGLAVTAIMLAWKLRGAMLLGVLITGTAGFIASRIWGESWGFNLVHWNGQIVEGLTGGGKTIGGAFQGLKTLFSENHIFNALTIIFIFLMLDIFDTIGTLVGVTERAGLRREDGSIPKAKAAFLSDGIGTMAGAGMGTSTITSYIESAAGISAGARTGIAPIVTGILLLASLFFYPVVEMIGGTIAVSPEVIGGFATEQAGMVLCHPVIAPVLILIGCYMMPGVAKIPWDKMDEAIPAFLTIIMMQFAFSISHGIAWGFISWTLLKLATGKWREIHPLLAMFSALFLLFLVAE